ncbi:Uncharacterised protein [Mycobacteroides abscessus subsp. abscessus]|nr:Uncharacterised protein [Mycobacteroides abscessus subsp. abscessus]
MGNSAAGITGVVLRHTGTVASGLAIGCIPSDGAIQYRCRSKG